MGFVGPPNHALVRIRAPLRELRSAHILDRERLVGESTAESKMALGKATVIGPVLEGTR